LVREVRVSQLEFDINHLIDYNGQSQARFASALHENYLPFQVSAHATFALYLLQTDMYRCAAIATTFSHADRLAASSTSDDGVPLYARAWDDAPVSLVSRALTHYGDVKSERACWRRFLACLCTDTRHTQYKEMRIADRWYTVRTLTEQRAFDAAGAFEQARLAIGHTALMTGLLPFLAHMRQVCRWRQMCMCVCGVCTDTNIE
jgi:hypothetical protein